MSVFYTALFLTVISSNSQKYDLDKALSDTLLFSQTYDITIGRGDKRWRVMVDKAYQPAVRMNE